MARTDVLLFPADDSAPAQGFYSVVLRRHCPERALGIICNDGIWFAYLDGQQFAEPSPSWKMAMGKLHDLPMLMGRKLSVEEYKKLMTRRIAERFNGIDHNKPVNHLRTGVAI